MKRVAQLDGLRGIAILLVVCCHYVGGSHPNQYIAWLARCGFCGVDLFFVLSGFLIGGILLENRDKSNYYSVFYSRRVLRIIPLFAILTVVFTLATPGMDHFSLLSNLTCTQDIAAANHIAAANQPILMGVVWSLAVEEKFYLIVAPVVRYLHERLGSVIVFVMVISPFIRVVETMMGGAAYARLLPFGRFDSLAIGLGIALLASRSKERSLKLAERAPWDAFAIAFILFFVWLASALYSELIFSFAGYSLLALIFGGIVLSVSSFPERWKILSFAPLQRVGVLSYSIYLMHKPIYYFSTLFIDGMWARIVVSSICTYALAEFSWWLLESRMIRRGQKLRFGHISTPAPAFALSLRSEKLNHRHGRRKQRWAKRRLEWNS